MTKRLHDAIHLISTDKNFQRLFTNNPHRAIAELDLPEEEKEVLLDMHKNFVDNREEVNASGPFGWNFQKSEMESNGPFGWNFQKQDMEASGPFGWNFQKSELESSGPFGWNFQKQDMETSGPFGWNFQKQQLTSQ